jgi:hypothetical protein
LGDQHPIEGIAVVRWQAPGRDRVGVRDGEFAEAHVPDLSGKVDRPGKLPGGLLDRR